MLTRIARVLTITVGALVGLVVIAGAAVFIISGARLGRTYTVAPEALALPAGGTASIERGRHLAVAAAHCTGCHGDNLAGRVMIDAPPFQIVAPNLTRGHGGVGGMSQADFVRAIRHGVAPDGRSLLLMPSQDFQALSDADLADILAYVGSVPPVDNQLPASTLRPLGRALLAAGQLQLLAAEQIDQSAPRPDPVPAGPTPAYGGYLVTVGGCRSCHGDNLAGSVVPDGSNMPAPGIARAGLAGWSEADFVSAMRTGVTPGGARLSESMPWKAVGQLSDEELRAVWLYLQAQ